MLEGRSTSQNNATDTTELNSDWGELSLGITLVEIFNANAEEADKAFLADSVMRLL